MVTISNQNSRKTTTIFTVIIGCFCLLSIISLQLPRVKKMTHAKPDLDSYLKAEEIEKLKLELLKNTPKFGFGNLAASWSMLQFLQYFGDSEARDQTGYSLSADYLEVIAENDPLFSRAYLIISPASSMFAGTPERTIEIMNKGLAKMSANTTDAYYVWLYKGVDEILFMGDLEVARKSYLKASEWAKIAKNDFIAQATSKTAQFLATKPDTKQAQVGVWFMVWNNNKDERIRQIAAAKIESIGGQLKIYPDGRVEAIPPKVSKS